MNRILTNNILRFILLIILQGTIFDSINLGGYVNPYPYIYFIILLPFNVPGWLLLLSSFLLGLGVDFFENSMGINAAASVLIAFLRPTVLKIISSGRDYDKNSSPSLFNYGFKWFVSYSFILIFVHHTTLFILEVFRFKSFFSTMERALLSSVFTLFLILLFQYLFSKPSK